MTTTLADPEIPDQALVARGRRIFLAMTAFFLALEGLRALARPYTELDIARVLLGIGLFYAAWFGQQWAIALLALGLPLGALFSFVLGFASMSPIGFVVGVAMAGFYIWLFLLFVKSESLNAFFKHQALRPKRDGAEEEADLPEEADSSQDAAATEVERTE
jgi:hypothetical protein